MSWPLLFVADRARLCLVLVCVAWLVVCALLSALFSSDAPIRSTSSCSRFLIFRAHGVRALHFGMVISRFIRAICNSLVILVICLAIIILPLASLLLRASRLRLIAWRVLAALDHAGLAWALMESVLEILIGTWWRALVHFNRLIWLMYVLSAAVSHHLAFLDSRDSLSRRCWCQDVLRAS